MLSFKLFENIQQAKKLLKDKKINDLSDFDKISKSLNKNPNYIYLFTKWRYIDKVSMDDINKVIDTIINGKHIIDLLPKNIIKYDKFEELIDDLTKANYKAVVNKFITDNIWYKSLKNSVKKYLKSNPQKSEIILEFIKLDDSLKNEFLSSLKYYKENKVSADSFFDELENFVDKKTLRDEELIKRIKSKGDKLKVVYNENNVIIITTRDQEVVKEFGSQKWCIVYSDHFFGTYIESKPTQQYICFNLNIPKTNYNSLFGITVYAKNKTQRGARQNSNNGTMEMEDISKSLGVDLSIFKSLSDEELKGFEPIVLLQNGFGDKLTEEQRLELTDTQKIKYGLITEEEKHRLDPETKVLNGFIDYLTQEDINELDSNMVERYEIPLSEDMVKRRDAAYKARTNNFKFLTSEDIEEINDMTFNSFENYEEVETWYKSLNLIDKLDGLDDIDVFELFVSPRDFVPFEDNYEFEPQKIDSIEYSEMEEFGKYTGGDLMYSEIMTDLNLGENPWNALNGFQIELDSDELNYMHYYINKDNFSKIKEIFGLEEDELTEAFGFRNLCEYFITDGYLLDQLSVDMDEIGNVQSNKFKELCPISFSWNRDGEYINLDLDKLREYLIKYEKVEYKTLYDWVGSGELFDSAEIDWDVLNEYTPSVSVDEAVEFNRELESLLDKYEPDNNTTLPKTLIDLGFDSSDGSDLSIVNPKSGEEMIISDIKWGESEWSEEIEDYVSIATFVYKKKKKGEKEWSSKQSGDINRLKAELSQLSLF